MLSSDIQRRFSGTARLWGPLSLEKLYQAHVAVVGLGGVGSWSAETLVRTGVGSITLVDMDHVTLSNINRQAQALDANVGQAKTEAMRTRLLQINPCVQIHCVDDFVTPHNWPKILPTLCNGVIDACDDFSAKLIMAQWALSRVSYKNIQSTIPSQAYVCVGAAGGKQLLKPVECADLACCTHDPLLAKLRYRLRKATGKGRDGKAFRLPCVFSREPITPPPGVALCDIEADLHCHGYGSCMAVTASFGLAAAQEVIRQILHPNFQLLSEKDQPNT